MFGQNRPQPPIWRILVYIAVTIALLVGLGWFNTHILGDHTVYPDGAAPLSSASAEAPAAG